MSTLLEWNVTAEHVERSYRNIPGYGMVVCFIRTTPRPFSLRVAVCAVVLPEGQHEPEIISDRQSGTTSTAKLFFEEFVNRIGHEMHVVDSTVAAPPPLYALTNQGKAIICLSCGMHSHSEEDAARRYCGYCKTYMVE